MRNRILHAIKLLSSWSSAVSPPEKTTISAHDGMGGGDVMGGGEFGGNNGWSYYSFGVWPNQIQQQQQPQPQAQVGSVHSIPNPTSAPGFVTFVIGLRMMIVLLVLILILDEAVQAIVKKYSSLLITTGSILIILPYPFDLKAGIPLPILLIGIIHLIR